MPGRFPLHRTVTSTWPRLDSTRTRSPSLMSSSARIPDANSTHGSGAAALSSGALPVLVRLWN